MSAMREELHHLVDELPEEEVRPVLELIRGRADASHGARDLPFFASFESDPDLAERSEEIVDAAVIAIAERLNLTEVATVDRKHFSIVRPRHVSAFRLLPQAL
jgi:hypothetical protein